MPLFFFFFVILIFYLTVTRLAIKEQHGISSDAIFDVAPDEATEEQKRKQFLKWDRKDMKYKKYNKEKLKIDTKLYPNVELYGAKSGSANFFFKVIYLRVCLKASRPISYV